MSVDREKKGIRILWRLTPYIRPYLRWFIINTVGAFAAGVLSIAVAYVAKGMIDKVLAGDYSSFYTDLVLMGLAVVLDTVVPYVNGIASSVFTSGFAFNLRNLLARHIQRLPVSFVDEHHSGDIISRANNDVTVLQNLVRVIPENICRPLIFIGTFVYLTTISWKLLFATIVLIPISAPIFDLISRPIQRHSKKVLEYKGQANSICEDTINGIGIVKSYNLQRIMRDKYAAMINRFQSAGLEVDRLNAWLFPIFLALRYTPQVICPIYGGYLAYTGDITIGSVIAFNLLVANLFFPVEVFMSFIRQIRESIPAIERVMELVDYPMERTGGVVVESDILKPEIAAVEFEGVSFSYRQDEKQCEKVLDDISFSVKYGETVALVGQSGSGKTTILKLLCGFYSPDAGTVRIFGQDIADADIPSVRSQMAYVSQETYLFPGTIIENIAYGKAGATDPEMIEAAEAAGAHGFISDLPDGYKTIVGEYGVNLSGGQRQRISLARAILKDAPIILLDEPTSALDTQSEAVVQRALEQMISRKSVIVVAHRLSTIKNADKILVLDNGRIEDSGTHEELMNRCAMYRKLYLRQSVAENDAMDIAAG